MGTIIEEVAFLDLTKASEDTLKEIKAIRNVAFMVYSEKFEPYMAQVSFNGIASSLKVEGELATVNGKMVFEESSAESIKDSVHYLVNGKFIIKPGVTAETIEKTISGLSVNGKIYCPESVQAAVRNKINLNNGKLISYMNDAELETGKVTIDNDYLKQLKDHTNLAVGGKANLLEELDEDLIDQKLNRLQLLGNAVISQANKEKLSEKWVSGYGEVTTVPSGYTYFDSDLHLDSDTITRYDQGQLFVDGVVTVDEDVSTDDIKNHLGYLKTDGPIYCRAEAKAEIIKKCDPLVKVVAYSGALRLIDGEYTLRKTELDYTPDKLTFVVNGVLNIDEAITAEQIYEKIERVDLNGVVSGNAEQCGVLQTKLKIKNGIVSEKGTSDEDQPMEELDGEHTKISNVSHLKL
ncbi:MAG TPA: hypothetical protein VFK27_04920 [Bacillales bacterium]|nr:hypothetical protein [Bacillales bacterium]